eukprot:8587065-Alexandrium_andersonii.AAC.1
MCIRDRGTVVGSCLRPIMSPRWWACAGLSPSAWACRLRWGLHPLTSPSPSGPTLAHRASWR